MNYFFSLLLINLFFLLALLSSYGSEHSHSSYSRLNFDIIDLKNKLPLIPLLEMRERFSKEESEEIIEYINQLSYDKLKENVYLLLKCCDNAKGYKDSLKTNIVLLIKVLCQEVPLFKMMNLDNNFTPIISEHIINYIDQLEGNNKLEYIYLSFYCNPYIEIYEEFIEKNKHIIMTCLKDIPLFNLLLMNYHFNRIISTMIIEYIKNNDHKKDKKDIIYLLLRCYYSDKEYKECLDENIDLLMDKLKEDINLEFAVDIPHDFNFLLCERMLTYIKNSNCKKECLYLLLNFHKPTIEKDIDQISKMLCDIKMPPLEKIIFLFCMQNKVGYNDLNHIQKYDFTKCIIRILLQYNLTKIKNKIGEAPEDIKEKYLNVFSITKEPRSNLNNFLKRCFIKAKKEYQFTASKKIATGCFFVGGLGTCLFERFFLKQKLNSIIKNNLLMVGISTMLSSILYCSYKCIVNNILSKRCEQNRLFLEKKEWLNNRDNNSSLFLNPSSLLRRSGRIMHRDAELSNKYLVSPIYEVEEDK